MANTHPLDRIPRAGYLLRGVTEPESVAAHSHSLAFLTLMVCGAYPEEFDSRRAVEMAIIHDLQEVATMDIPLPAGTEAFKAAKEDTEQQVFESLFGSLSPGLTDVYREFRANESAEARLVRGLDKVQMMIKVMCYQREGRGILDDFWKNPVNFRDYGLPVIGELFAEVARRAGKTLPA